MAVAAFQKNIESLAISVDVIVTDQPTKTAQEAADTHNVPVSNIVKSLLVKADDEFVLILVPGHKRLDLDFWKKKLGSTEIRMSTPDEVKSVTGFSIGGVPPFGHKTKLRTYIDEGFDTNVVLFAAAGSSNSVFKIEYQQLVDIIS